MGNRKMNGQKTKNGKQQKKPSLQQALKKSSLAFWAMTPMLIGVIGLVGLFQVLVTPNILTSLFRGNAIVDTLVGTFIGRCDCFR